jgi:hypothetical protein
VAESREGSETRLEVPQPIALYRSNLLLLSMLLLLLYKPRALLYLYSRACFDDLVAILAIRSRTAVPRFHAGAALVNMDHV